MKSSSRQPLLALAALSVLALAACHKKQPEAPTVSESAAPAAAPAQAAAPAPSAEQEALDQKKKDLAHTLAEDALLNDPNGQWAVTATASSAWEDSKDNDAHSPAKATGKPNCADANSCNEAWENKQPAVGLEWLKLDYAKPIHATAVNVRQPTNAGAVAKIELIDANGTSHTLWSGVDDTQYDNRYVSWLKKSCDPTPYLVKSVKLTLAVSLTNGMTEVDAVQLVGQ